MADKNKTSAKVIPLHPLKAKKASERKWGKEVMDFGFCIIPSLLLRAQARLKLNPTHLAIVLHLADFWWEAERKLSLGLGASARPSSSEHSRASWWVRTRTMSRQVRG